MQAFTTLTARAMPLDRANVDTDAIIPKQYLKSIKKSGFGPFLFDDWRYLDPGTLALDPKSRRKTREFVLHRPEFGGAQVLRGARDSGCGWEAAVWGSVAA